MKLNVGGIDRILRIVVGLALIGWCPAYAIFGFNACPMKTQS